MAPRKKCPICGCRKWRKDSATGMVTCSEGHVLQNYRTESGDAEDYGNHTMRKRTLKSARKMETVSKEDPKLYHGDRARFHYYQCLQLLLRKQISALISLWSLPQEFEMICRDLWALHLTLIRDPPPAEPLQYAQETKGPMLGMHNDLSDAKVFGDDQQNSDARHSSDEDSTDSELEALLQENSESSTASEDEDQHARKKYHVKLGTRFVGHSDRPENTIAVLVLACWTIRLPLVYMDIINAIEGYSVPYLDHVRLLPSSLTCHLTKHAIQALSPHHAPRTPSLHRLVSRLANRLHSNFGISIPGLNVAPVLWRVVRQCFCGTREFPCIRQRGYLMIWIPAMLYTLSKRLGNVLSLSISLHSLVPFPSGVEGRGRYNVPPEVALAGTLVYGLDGKRRLPRIAEDVACTFPDVDEFLATLREGQLRRTVCFDGGKGMPTQRYGRSVGDLDHATMDCDLGGVRKPTDATRSHAVITSGSMIKARSPMKTNDSNPDILQPGESYTIYHSEDVLGMACRWVGVSSDYLCSAVERYERRLVRWWQAERQHDGADAAPA
ncbi:hypothetical protein EDC04DRAFT_2864473 [Pisolithus marmoratus]|nr:hypothetical protein EDC04DRAFT_2864473 [Pisolithus marmoratus]